MRREVSINRLAKSAGVNPEDVVLALIDRGIEIDDPDKSVEGATWKAARSIIKELRGGPVKVRAKPTGPEHSFLEPAAASSSLVGLLSADDVLFIHDRLCADFAQTADPIDPPGLRSRSLLESAVSRQHSGYEDLIKYHDPVLNAATLLYGICNDHPFYNGNKRTALVSALAHLDCNQLVLGSTKQSELFRLMIAIADHSIVQTSVKIGRETEQVPRRGTADEEVEAIANWFRPRVQAITRGETPVTYRELKQILGSFNYLFNRLKNQKVSISAVETRRTFFRRKQRHATKLVIKWPGDGKTVPIGQIKHIRQKLGLCEEDGVTRDAFYLKGLRIDRFINDYRIVLRKLANR